MYHCKKTGYTTEKKQSYINHIRNVYPSQLDAYIGEIGQIPICKYCNTSSRKLISVLKGLYEHCGSDVCKHSYIVDRNRQIAYDKKKGKDGYDEYLENNIDSVKKLYFENIPFYDEFLGKLHVNTYFIYLNSPSKLTNSCFYEDRICRICNSEFKTHISKNKTTCCVKCDKIYAAYVAKSVKNDIKTVELFNDFNIVSKSAEEFSLFLKNNRNYSFKKEFKREHFDKYLIYKSLKNHKNGTIFYDNTLNLYCVADNIRGIRSNVTAMYLYKFNFINNDTITEIYPIRYCICCNSEIHTNPTFEINENNQYVNIVVAKFDYCDQSCYHKTLATNKSGLYPYSAEYKKNQSDKMKELILEGKYTPNSNNRRTHWFEVENMKFRSSWEYAYWILFTKFFNYDIIYEELRIKYFCTKSNSLKIYIGDFIDHTRKIAIEVKPAAYITKEITKIRALYDWAKNNGYSVHIISEYFFINLPDNQKQFILNNIAENSNNLCVKINKLLYANITKR